MSRQKDLARIGAALDAAAAILRGFTPGAVESARKTGGDPVTQADLRVNEALRKILPEGGEGWLSEETADDRARLDRRRVWVVDPLDGTREFVMGLPEWSVSIGLVEDGEPVAGGILNPATAETILGSIETGVTLNGRPAAVSARTDLTGADVVASRSEMMRGEWERFREAPFRVRPIGSVAYKLGMVAAGLADATWTCVPKNEWDVAAGVALVRAAGGVISLPGGGTPHFNRENPLLPGLVASPPALAPQIVQLLRGHHLA